MGSQLVADAFNLPDHATLEASAPATTPEVAASSPMAVYEAIELIRADARVLADAGGHMAVLGALKAGSVLAGGGDDAVTAADDVDDASANVELINDADVGAGDGDGGVDTDACVRYETGPRTRVRLSTAMVRGWLCLARAIGDQDEGIPSDDEDDDGLAPAETLEYLPSGLPTPSAVADAWFPQIAAQTGPLLSFPPLRTVSAAASALRASLRHVEAALPALPLDGYASEHANARLAAARTWQRLANAMVHTVTAADDAGIHRNADTHPGCLSAAVPTGVVSLLRVIVAHAATAHILTSTLKQLSPALFPDCLSRGWAMVGDAHAAIAGLLRDHADKLAAVGLSEGMRSLRVGEGGVEGSCVGLWREVSAACMQGRERQCELAMHAYKQGLAVAMQRGRLLLSPDVSHELEAVAGDAGVTRVLAHVTAKQDVNPDPVLLQSLNRVKSHSKDLFVRSGWMVPVSLSMLSSIKILQDEDERTAFITSMLRIARVYGLMGGNHVHTRLDVLSKTLVFAWANGVMEEGECSGEMQACEDLGSLLFRFSQAFTAPSGAK
jgi:hypothetical protein